ncbi:MAG: acetate--CoA ligase family protein [bacterium]
MSPLQGFFYPDSVAIFGVSPKYDNFGRNIVKNLIDFEYRGKIYPIGLEGGAVYGMTIHRSLEEINDEVSLALFLIPAKTIPEHLRACAAKGVKRIVISSGGFSEFGDDRKPLENEILKIARENGMRIIGPNGLALINNEIGLCLPFVRLSRFNLGTISFMTQSGGMGLTLISLFAAENIGLNKYVSLGNKLDVGETDLLPFLNDDEKTEIICLYLEEIEKGQEFMRIMRGVKKPVIVYKANTTAEGARIAMSHTAAIANDDRVVDAALRQARAIRVPDMRRMVPTAKALSLPRMNGNRVAVMSPTGGYAVILADQCEKQGFTLPPFPDNFIRDISSHVRAGVINLKNPLDLGDLFDMEMIALTMTRALQEEGFDALILGWVFLRDTGMIMSGSVNVFHFLEKMIQHYRKPIVLSIVGDPSEVMRIKKRTALPIFDSPEEAVEALGALYTYSRRLDEIRPEPEPAAFDHRKVNGIIRNALKNGRDRLSFAETLDVLGELRVPSAPTEFAADPRSAAASAAQLTAPVALKILSPDILHKTEHGGVRLNLASPSEVEKAAAEMLRKIGGGSPDAKIAGFAVQEMIHCPREVIVGAKRNREFGTVVVFGLGGILVEAVEDVAMRIAPLTPADAREMIAEIKGAKALGAFRGFPPADTNALENVILAVSSLMTACPAVAEIDINPLMIHDEGKGCTAVDARIVIKAADKTGPP